MARTDSDDVRRHQEAARDRVVWVLTHRFAGRQRAMARATGISQATLSRAARGQFSVSHEVVEALAALPGINPDWARVGVGDPLLPPTAGTLPFALGVLPGPPADHARLLTGERHPVAAAHDRPTRYLYRVPDGCPLGADRGLALKVGDLLLLDADRDVWAGRLDHLIGAVFGVCVRRPGGPVYLLGVLRRKGGLFVDLCPGELWPGRAVPSDDPAGPAESEKPVVRRRINPRLLNIGKEAAAATAPTADDPVADATADPVAEPSAGTSPAVAPDAPLFQWDDLVALRVYTLRPGP